MRRRVLWALVLVLVVVVGGSVALVATGRPALVDDRAAVDERWVPLRDPLVHRYQALQDAHAALAAAGASDRAVGQALQASLERWNDALAGGSPDAVVAAANRLEGAATRLRANVVASARLASDARLVATIAAFEARAPAPDLVRAYNEAVHSYESDRNESLKRPVAALLGFGPRPVLVVAGS